MKKLYIAFAAAILASACTGVNVTPVPAPVQDPGTINADPFNLQDISSYLVPGDPGLSVVTAGIGSGTRTHLQSGAGDTSAKVVWTAGDAFRMISFDVANSKNYYYADYTTSDSGPDATFTSSSILSTSGCHSIYYPNKIKLALYDSKPLFGFNIPKEQTPIPGDIGEGLNIAYAYSDVQTADLHFVNVPAIVRFRLAGPIVPDVTKLTIKGQSAIAGDFTIAPEGGTPYISSVRFTTDETSNSLSLAGSFTAGEYYYAVVIPSAQRVSFIFENAAGNTLTKITSSQIDFRQGRITDLGTINLGDSFSDVPPAEPLLYIKATTSLNPVTVAVVPEGFTASQMSDYEILARSAVDALFNTEPFKSYKEYFNVWLLYVNSNESGASVSDGSGNIVSRVDSYFGARWGTESYSDMRANDSAVFDFVAENCPDVKNGLHTVKEVPILMIVNDTRYGGICISFGDGSGYCIAPYSEGGAPLRWDFPSTIAVNDADPASGLRAVTQDEAESLGHSVGDWRNIVVHEFGGHCFARLGDEYWYNSVKSATSIINSHNWQVPFGLNISATYDSPLWKADLLDNQSSLVSANPLYSRVGVYQGGDVSALNRWRSEMVSCMIDNRFYFSTWQRILIVKRIMELAHGSFSLSDFFAKDKAADPLRDEISSGTPGMELRGPVRVMPLLPPPVLIER